MTTKKNSIKMPSMTVCANLLGHFKIVLCFSYYRLQCIKLGMCTSDISNCIFLIVSGKRILQSQIKWIMTNLGYIDSDNKIAVL